MFFLCFIFMHMPLGLIVESYKKIQKLLVVEKDIKLHFP